MKQLGCVIYPVLDRDKHISRDEEYSDSEDEGEGGRHNHVNYAPITKKARTEGESKGGIFFMSEVRTFLFRWCSVRFCQCLTFSQHL